MPTSGRSWVSARAAVTGVLTEWDALSAVICTVTGSGASTVTRAAIGLAGEAVISIVGAAGGASFWISSSGATVVVVVVVVPGSAPSSLSSEHAVATSARASRAMRAAEMRRRIAVF